MTNHRARIIRAAALAICGTAMLAAGPAAAADKIIVVVEKSTDPKAETNHANNSTNLPANGILVLASDLDSAQTGVLAQVGNGDCIKELHFRGHAAPGVQGVGDGKTYDANKQINTGAAKWKTKLAGIKAKLCANATIKLWGCNIGANAAGAAKLQEIADFFGATVTGSTDTVTSGGQNTYAGGIQTATPGKPAPAPIAPNIVKAKKKAGN